LHQRLYFRDTIVRVAIALAIAGLVLSTVWYATPNLMLGPGVTIVSAALILVGLAIVRLYLLSTVAETAFRGRTLVVGTGKKSEAIQQIRRRADRRGFRVVGCVCIPGPTNTCSAENCLGHDRSLLDVALTQRADEIVVAMQDMRGNLAVDQ